jgi:pyruvate,water dikinase
MSGDLCEFEEIGPGDVEEVGGKGLSLGLMARAGLPVPAGFCVTSRVHRRLRGQGLGADPSLISQIHAAWRKLGDVPVAVRSSATAEDTAETSFAGQQETILGVRGAEAVCSAIERCWTSLDNDRARAYRRRHGVDEDSLAMGVVVQQLVQAEVAGVLFTHNPLDPEGKTMLVEASWGLGESVVSGKVMPDRFIISRSEQPGSAAVLDRQIAVKVHQVTADGPGTVPPEKQSVPCLSDTQLTQLAELGRQVESFYKGPRDVEWAWAEGRFWLLQARPITTADAAEREQVRREEIARLLQLAEPTGTVWSRFNLSEILPTPTPLTWSIVRRFMSGKGGFGLMYRDLGFDPDPALDKAGVFDLVCGRPYCNLSREPRLHYRQLPYEHPFAALKAEPRRAMYPQPVINPARGGWKFWLWLPITLPRVLARMVGAGVKQQALAQEFPRRFREEIIPAFVRETDAERSKDLSGLSESELLDRLEFWIQRTLYQFARESLKPTALAALAMGRLEQKLASTLGAEKAQEEVRSLVMGVHPDPEADLPTAVRDVSEGRLAAEQFLERFGHRGSQEMELSQPRWAEDPSSAPGQRPGLKPSPEEAGLDRPESPGLSEGPQATAKADLEVLKTQLALRETAKHHLMRGYALIRRVLVELDRRHRLHGGIFYLELEELPRLVQGEDFSKTIAARKRRRSLALSLEVPAVLFSDDLEAIGRPAPVIGTNVHLQGVPLSAGVAEAKALVREQSSSCEVPEDPYILVCPSTDPAWVPLLVKAKGLVLETGGVLSHGAIVAREFGLPAVAGLPGITKALRDGQRLRVDGVHGTVTVLG